MSRSKTVYLVITTYKKSLDSFVEFSSNNLDEAKTEARSIANTDKDDAHTFLVDADEWENGNYNEISF